MRCLCLLPLLLALSQPAYAQDPGDFAPADDRHDHGELPDLTLEQVVARLGGDDSAAATEAARVAETLGLDALDRVAPRLGELLLDEARDEELRQAAAHTLGLAGDREACRILFQALTARAEELLAFDGQVWLGHDELLDEAVLAIVERGDPAAVSGARALLERPEALLHGAALMVLTNVGAAGWDDGEAGRAAELARLAHAWLGDAASDPRLREASAWSLSTLGPRATPHLSLLLEALLDDDLAEVAEESLARLGEVSLPALLEGLRHDDAAIRAGCAHSLRRVDPAIAAAPGREGLIANLEHASARVRRAAVWALWKLGLGAQALEQVTPLLNDPSGDVRRYVYDLLRELPRQEALTGPLLERLEAETNSWNRALLLRTVGRHGTTAAVGPLLKELELGDPLLLEAVYDALADLGPRASSAAPPLAERLRAVDYSFGHPAWRTLPRLGPAALEHLLPILKQPDRLNQRLAAQSLALGGPALIDGAEAVAAAFESARYTEVRHALAVALAEIRGQSPPAPLLLSEEIYGQLTPDGRGPERPHHPAREGRAKVFHVDPLVRSAATEDLVEDWEALGRALEREQARDPALALETLVYHDSPDARQRAWFNHLRPELELQDQEDLPLLVLGQLTRLSLAQLEQVVGEPLALGDLVQTDAYRGTLTLIVAERLSASGEPELRLVEPFRVEDYVTPPSYLRYPSVVPSLSFWEAELVDRVPVDHAFAREHLEGDRIVIEGRRWTLDDESLSRLTEDPPTQQLYLRIDGSEAAWFQAPGQVDRSPPLE